MKQEKHLSLERLDSIVYISQVRTKFGGCTVVQRDSLTNRYVVRNNTYILFAGREVRIEKNCARGLEYGPRPQAEGRAQDRGHSFSQYGPTKAGK